MTRTYDRTKIIATLGPSSSDYNTILALIENGADVFRLNFSHGSHEDKVKVISHIRQINKENNWNIGIIADLQGPKIRLGKIKNEHFELDKGDKFTITNEDIEGTHKKVSISYPQFPKDVQSGDKILVDDGKIELLVLETDGEAHVQVQMLNKGVISSNKGVNLPDTSVTLPSITVKDIEDLKFAVDNKLDWIALSFVRSANDILALKEKIVEFSSEMSLVRQIKVIAKIEKPQAVQYIDDIIQATDAVMIARGDLGVEMQLQEVPLIQKKIVLKCLDKAKPVIIATQMMESMMTNPKPTRAEVNDVANAIIDGADAVMLSGETAVGSNPVMVVKTMKSIITRVEQEKIIYHKEHTADPESDTFISDAICYQAAHLAHSVNAIGIIGMTRSGYTAYMCSSYRPKARIFVFTDNKRLLNRLSLVWGVRGFFYDKMESTDNSMADVQEELIQKGYLKKGDTVVNIASMPIHQQARANMVKVTKIE